MQLPYGRPYSIVFNEILIKDGSFRLRSADRGLGFPDLQEVVAVEAMVIDAADATLAGPDAVNLTNQPAVYVTPALEVLEVHEPAPTAQQTDAEQMDAVAGHMQEAEDALSTTGSCWTRANSVQLEPSLQKARAKSGEPEPARPCIRAASWDSTRASTKLGPKRAGSRAERVESLPCGAIFQGSVYRSEIAWRNLAGRQPGRRHAARASFLSGEDEESDSSPLSRGFLLFLDENERPGQVIHSPFPIQQNNAGQRAGPSRARLGPGYLRSMFHNSARSIFSRGPSQARCEPKKLGPS
jgi:hypothetical protein